MNTKTLIAAGILAAVSSQASAFSFTQDSVFDNVVQTSGLGSMNSTVTPHNLDEYGTLGSKRLEWNNNGNPVESALEITNFSGDLVVDVWSTISTLTHENNVIITPSYSWTGSILSNLRLYGDDLQTPATLILSDFLFNPVNPSQIDIDFLETGNVGGTCLPGSTSVCDDIFTFTGDFSSINFGDYRLDFRLVGSSGVTVNGDDTGGTVLTPEGGTNSVNVDMRITYIPEPAMLALMGIGLVGFGLGARRKANS